MSTYAQVSDVTQIAPQMEFSAATKPSDGDVQGFLDTVEAELNATLGNLGYTVPIPATAPESIKILRLIAAYGALALALSARGFGLDPAVVDQAAFARQYYDGRIKALRSGKDPMVLPDAVTSDASPIKELGDAMGSTADDACLGDFASGDVENRRPSMSERF